MGKYAHAPSRRLQCPSRAFLRTFPLFHRVPAISLHLFALVLILSLLGIYRPALPIAESRRISSSNVIVPCDLPTGVRSQYSSNSTARLLNRPTLLSECDLSPCDSAFGAVG